jgi:DNA-binding NtrC family response regulator
MLSKSILVVDDDQNLRRSLALILERAGYQVVTAGRACDALDCLEASNYDLVILDIMMPDNGLTLLPKILVLYPYLQILILTAHSSAETTFELERLGAHSHLVKPVTPERILESVGTMLSQLHCVSGGS